MKRRQIVKWLMLMVVVLVATVTWGDLAGVPSPRALRALSHSEWVTAMERRTAGLSQSVVLYLHLAIFLVISLATLIFSWRKRRKIYLLLLAWWAPLASFIPITYDWEEWSVLGLSILGVSLVSCLVLVVSYSFERKFYHVIFCLIELPIAYVYFWQWIFGMSCLQSFKVTTSLGGVSADSQTIEIRDGESYEEYLKRANRDIKGKLKKN